VSEGVAALRDASRLPVDAPGGEWREDRRRAHWPAGMHESRGDSSFLEYNGRQDGGGQSRSVWRGGGAHAVTTFRTDN
jgi:hypothetical protein